MKFKTAASSTNPSLIDAISPSFSLVPSDFVTIVMFSYSNPLLACPFVRIKYSFFLDSILPPGISIEEALTAAIT